MILPSIADLSDDDSNHNQVETSTSSALTSASIAIKNNWPATEQDTQALREREACGDDLTCSILTTRETKKAAAKLMKLPEAFTITASQVNEASHSRRIGKKRERRLKMKANEDVRQALEEISKHDVILKTSKSMAEIDAAHSLRRSYSDKLRAFEKSRARQKDLLTQRLRTNRTWVKLTAAERQYIKDHARMKTEEDLNYSGWFLYFIYTTFTLFHSTNQYTSMNC